MIPLPALMLAATAPANAPAAPRPATGVPAAAAGATTSTTASPPRPDRTRIMAAVRAEWPRYDGGNKGRLTPLEFSTWVVRANGGRVASAGKPKTKADGIAPTSAMNASATAFARADSNHDGGVTPDEMVSFLAQPQPPTALAKAKQPAGGAPASRPATQ